MTVEELTQLISNLEPGGKYLCITLPIENCTPEIKERK